MGQTEINNENGASLMIYPGVANWENKEYQFIIVKILDPHPIPLPRAIDNGGQIKIIGKGISLEARGYSIDSIKENLLTGYLGLFLIDDLDLFDKTVSIKYNYDGKSQGIFKDVQINNILVSLDFPKYNGKTPTADSKWYIEWLKSVGVFKIDHTIATWPEDGKKYKFICIRFEEKFSIQMYVISDAASMVVFHEDIRVKSKGYTHEGCNLFLVDDFDELQDKVTIAYVNREGDIISFLQNVNLKEIESLENYKKEKKVPPANKKWYNEWLKTKNE